MRYMVTRKANPVSLFDEFDSYFNKMVNNFGVSENYGRFAVDVVKAADAYRLTADLPGFSDDEIEVQIEKNVLTISATHAERSDDKESSEKEENPSYLLKERKELSYKRSFTLPEDINTDEVKANVSRGQLVLEIPRAEAEKPKMIKVKSA